MLQLSTKSVARVAVLAVCCLALSTSASLRANDGDLAAPIPAGTTSTTTTMDTPCVLLRNDNVLYGEARQVGEFVVIQTGQESEIKLSRQDVLCWARSLRNLYRYRVDHRQSGDLSAMLRDAKWCLRYDLFDLTAHEIRHIYAIDPNNAEARAIEERLCRQFAAASVKTVPAVSNERTEQEPAELPVVDSSQESKPSVRIVGYNGLSDPENEDSIAVSPPIHEATWSSQDEDGLVENVGSLDHPGSDDESSNVDMPTLRRFASHIQPMLSNRCGRCHDAARNEHEGWTIQLPPAGARAPSRMTRDNLVAALAYIDSKHPEQSELLVKATADHGGDHAPLDARDAKAINSLRSWLWMAADSIVAPSTEPPRVASVAFPPQGNSSEAALPSLDPGDHDPAAPPPSNDATVGPMRLPLVDNPFDPDLFNRRFHPSAGQ